jgi:hypothetical protein
MRHFVSRILGVVLVSMPFAVVAQILARQRAKIILHMEPQKLAAWLQPESIGYFYSRVAVVGALFVICVEAVAFVTRLALPRATTKI